MKKLSSALALAVTFAMISAACSKAPIAPSFAKRGAGSASPDDGEGSDGEDGTAGTLGDDPAVKAEAALNLALDEEFENFANSVDKVDLKSLDNAGQVPALVLKSQLAISTILQENDKEETAKPKGRCLVFASGDKVLTEKDVVSKDFELSPGGKFLYTVEATHESGECQKLFKENLAERYKTDFFNLHEVFYGVK